MSNKTIEKDPDTIVNTTISVSWKTRTRVQNLKERAETFDDVINRLVDRYEKKTGQ